MAQTDSRTDLVKMNGSQEANLTPKIPIDKQFQSCLQCESPIGVLAGSVDAICKKCGYKDPCCE